MPRQYRNKYVISPENTTGGNTEVIHVLQYNSSTDDVPLDVEEGQQSVDPLPQRKNRPQEAPSSEAQLDPPGSKPPVTSVAVPSDSSTKTKRPNNGSTSNDCKEPSKPTFDLNKTIEDSLEKEPDIQFFAHSRLWTCLAVLCAWTGFGLALSARNSTQFVTIKIPMYFDPNYNTVTQLGMVNLELCFNSTYIPGYEGCMIDKLGSEEVSDIKYQLARSFATLVVWLGGFGAVMITSSIFWYSINLRPLGFCFLISYFLESFSFIFLDSQVCKNHGCSVDTGGYLGIAASAFWMLASVASSRMDAYKYQQAARKKRRHLRMLRRKQRMEIQKTSNITEITNISLTDSDSWENSSSDKDSSDDSSGSGSEPEVFNRTLVSEFATSTDAVETTFVSFDQHDIEQGVEQDPPATESHQESKTKRKKSKRRVEFVQDDINLERHQHWSPRSPFGSKSRKELDNQVPKSPLAGSARTVELFRAKLVRHQTT